jgi:endonuclease-3
MNAPSEELAETIKSSGMFRIKAKRIQASLNEIQSRVGALDISFLNEKNLEEAKEWLTSLYGVGPKTAAIVLLFSFGKPALPVDTHVWRITKRLGLVPSDATAEAAQPILESVIPKSCIYSMNHNLVKHGREVCIARNPKCMNCFLSSLCDYYTSKQF